MEIWLGIDFGTCSTRAAFVWSGELKIVKEPTRHGFAFPSSAFLNAEGDLIVGQIAENQSQSDPTRFRREFKRDIGSADPYILGGVEKLPRDLVTAMLSHVRIEAEHALRGLSDDGFAGVVLTVPATFETYKRKLMEDCARDAGFSQVRLLQEPVAAARYHARESRNAKLSDGDMLLVYDLGGGTFDAALLQASGQSFVPLCLSGGIDHCGGIDLDRAIYDDMRKRLPKLREKLETVWDEGRKVFVDKPTQDPATLRLRLESLTACRQVKHDLSGASSTKYVSPSTAEEYMLTRSALEVMLSPLLRQTLDACRRLTVDAWIELSDIRGVLLVGGSCRIPAVEEAVAAELNLPTFRVSDPEMAVCLGAATAMSKMMMYKVRPENAEAAKAGPGVTQAGNEAVKPSEPSSFVISDPELAGHSKVVEQQLDSSPLGPATSERVPLALPPPIEIRRMSIKRAARAYGVTGAMLVATIWGLFHGWIVIACFFAIPFALAIMVLGLRKTSMVLSWEGIDFRDTKTVNRIAWSDIQQSGAISLHSKDMLGIRLSSYDRYLNHLSPSIASQIFKQLPYLQLMGMQTIITGNPPYLSLWSRGRRAWESGGPDELNKLRHVSHLAGAMSWARSQFQYDIIIPASELDRPVSDFVALLEKYRMSAIASQAEEFAIDAADIN